MCSKQEEINTKFNVSMDYSILPNTEYSEYKSYENKKQYLNYILIT